MPAPRELVNPRCLRPAGGGLGLRDAGPPGPPGVTRQLRVEMGGGLGKRGRAEGRAGAGRPDARAGTLREGRPGADHHLRFRRPPPPSPFLGLREAPRGSVSRRIRAAGLVPGPPQGRGRPAHRTHVHTRPCVHAHVHAHDAHGTHIPGRAHTFTRLQCTPAHTCMSTHDTRMHTHCSHTHIHPRVLTHIPTLTRAHTQGGAGLVFKAVDPRCPRSLRPKGWQGPAGPSPQCTPPAGLTG